MAVEFDEYKGNKMIKLLDENNDGKWPFSFGKTKAKTSLQTLTKLRSLQKKNKLTSSKNTQIFFLLFYSSMLNCL